MPISDLIIAKPTRHIGAEISSVDLGRPHSKSEENAVYDALNEHCVIFFRDQDIVPEHCLAFARSFAKLEQLHFVFAHVEGYEAMVKLANDANDPLETNGWNANLSFKQNLAFASILFAREAP